MTTTHAMFCYQCEQTAGGTGCTKRGVCGKDADTARMQDLLVHATKGISQYAHRAAQLGARDDAVDVFTVQALFTTVTNVNFDAQRIADRVRRAAEVRDQAKALYEEACRETDMEPETLAGPAAFQPADTMDGLLAQGREVGVDERLARLGPDVTGLLELTVYGAKGAAAYADHAQVLGRLDPEAFATFHELLDAVASEPTDIGTLKGLALKAGQLNYRVMELLDEAHTSTFGHPQPTAVRVTPVAGK
ncbi:MAG: hydroxylamine reductase, partial [Planctomycetes bacterium]|nr:hydroxylamine reductase [Planctomycetota bacterium]